MAAQTANSVPAPLGRYVLIFTGVYLVVLVLVALVLPFFKIDAGAGAALLEPLIAALVAGGSFVRTQQRLPSRPERRRLAWLSLWTSWAVSLLGVGLLLAYLLSAEGRDALMSDIRQLDRLPIWFWPAVVLLGSIIQFGILAFSYGFLTRTIYGRAIKPATG